MSKISIISILFTNVKLSNTFEALKVIINARFLYETTQGMRGEEYQEHQPEI